MCDSASVVNYSDTMFSVLNRDSSVYCGNNSNNCSGSSTTSGQVSDGTGYKPPACGASDPMPLGGPAMSGGPSNVIQLAAAQNDSAQFSPWLHDPDG